MGDEIHAYGQARAAHAKDPRHVQILDRCGVPRWHPIWDGSDILARPDEKGDFQRITNGPGHRPYIAGRLVDRWVWRECESMPGRIHLTAKEKFAAAPYCPQVIIEPNLKNGASPNKQWGAANWRDFVRLGRIAGLRLVQLGPGGTRPMQGVSLIETPTFRHACAVLARAKVYVGPDGGMHHAAAALGLPAVVIMGGYISPAQTGYAMHRNLFTGGEPCGMRVPCRHCAAAMAKITPGMVLDELRAIL